MSTVDVLDVAAMPWGPSMVPQRGGKMAHKRLFDGVEGTPDNYSFVLADESNEYVSPRHRHPWDQVRVCLAGAIPIGRTATVEAGEIAYFPEGVAYGPQEGGVDRLVLLLQFGGASGLGFLSFEQVSKARDELAEAGSFEQGVYVRHSPGPGERAKQDGYEAVWEHVTGERLEYPEGITRAPIVLRPPAFPWATEGGVSRRVLGTFEPRGLSLDVWRITAGDRLTLSPGDRRQFAFVSEGSGQIAGTPYDGHAAARLEPGATAQVEAATDTELVTITVRTLSGDH